MSDMKPCAECGMPCEPGEYHPFAACLMFKASHDSKLVRESLQAVRNDAISPSNVVDITAKVPAVLYGISIEQGPDGVRKVHVHDVADTPSDRAAVAFALRESADIIDGQSSKSDEGITLRDWFAGKELSKIIGPLILDEPVMYERLAKHCYRMADAMIRARENSHE